jgi:MYXO-CTERM domain-containing protein
MKKLMITAAAFMSAVAAYGQGQFLFNTHDTGNNNVLTFTDTAGNKIADANWFLKVLVGADAGSLKAITGDAGKDFAINRKTGAGAATGFTDPFSQIYTVAGSPKNTTVTVGYQAYMGTDYATATSKSDLKTATVVLSEPPATPTEVTLGNQTITLPTGGGNVPEPATWALGLLGLGSLLAIRRRK